MLLRCTEPAPCGIDSADPGSADPTLADVNRGRKVYLVSDARAETDADRRRWAQDLFAMLRQCALESWDTDEVL